MAKKKMDIPMMIVATKVKDFVAKELGSRSAGDLVPELNERVARLLSDAVGRCEGNGRGTVRAVDL